MTRNPKRIPETLAVIGRIWNRYPDLRLGQLLINFGFKDAPTENKIYNQEDEVTLENLKLWEKKLTQKTKDRLQVMKERVVTVEETQEEPPMVVYPGMKPKQ